MVILTATSGTLTATAAVTVKSGVAGLSVTPDLVKAGSDVTVTATGKAGGGTVKVMDADAMQVGVTKSLDPVRRTGRRRCDLQPYHNAASRSRRRHLYGDGRHSGLDRTAMDIEVLNNQAPPMLSDATALVR